MSKLVWVSVDDAGVFCEDVIGMYDKLEVM